MRGLDIGGFSEEELLCAPFADAVVDLTLLACCRNRAAPATLLRRFGNQNEARRWPTAAADGGR